MLNATSEVRQMGIETLALPPNTPIRIVLGGTAGVWLDEAHYDEILETLQVLQENPNIVQSLTERMSGEFISEEEFWESV